MPTDIEQVYLEALVKDEIALSEARDTLAQLTASYNLATRRYAATRDMVEELLEPSPYSDEFAQWPGAHKQGPYALGAFRFIHMTPGTAITIILNESEKPLSLDDIVDAMVEGGFGSEGGLIPVISARAVNAALMRTSGIVKNEDGTYRYETEMPEEGLTFPQV